MSLSTSPDVVIAGAGPVGLFLACELRLAGASVMVLEKVGHPDASMKKLPFGMRGLSVPTLEAFYRRGLLDDVREPPDDAATAPPAHWMRQPRRPGGHFAGIPFHLDKVDVSKWPYYLPSPAGTSLATTMAHLEGVLAKRAAAMGAEIRHGVSVNGVEQTSDGLVVHTSDEAVPTRWLVGCDGGRSTVRWLGGFEFAGTDPEFTGYSVDVELADPGLLAPGRHYTPTGMYTYQPPGTVAMVDFDGGAFHRSEVTLDQVQSVLRKVAGVEVTVTALTLATTWTDRAFQASSYRQGRVLLAGDAAHIHSPLGGQGLNLGLGDAMNLGWKLGAVIRGGAAPMLLDTYFVERHPVATRVLDWSRAQVAIMRPSPGSRALETLMRDLIDTPDGASYVAERVSGATIRYDLGDGHPLVGRSVPDFELADGSRLGPRLDGRGVLLEFGDSVSVRERLDGRLDRIAFVKGAARADAGIDIGAALVRPDGVVAWASGRNETPDTAALAQALFRWFGQPSAAGMRR